MNIPFLEFFAFLVPLVYSLILFLPHVPNIHSGSGFSLAVSLLLLLVGLLSFRKRQEKKLPSFCWKLGLWVFPVISCFHSFSLIQHFWTSGFLSDLDYIGISDVLESIVSGKGYVSHYYGSGEDSYLAHHFSPGIAILSPFLYLSQYRLGYAYGLIFLQILFFFLLYHNLRIRETKPMEIYLIFSLVSTNLYFYRLANSLHFEFLFPVLFLLLDILLIKKRWVATLFALLLLMTLKEDIPFYLAVFFFFYSWEKGTKQHRTTSLVFSLICILAFLTIPELQIYLYHTRETWLSGWKHLGSSPLTILQTILTHPIDRIQEYLGHWRTVRDIFLSFGLLPFASFLSLCTILVLFFLPFSSRRIWYKDLYNYYIYSMFPFLVRSSLEGWKQISLYMDKKGRSILSILLLVLAMNTYRNSRDSSFPYTIEATKQNRWREAMMLTQEIPPGASVSSSPSLSGYLRRSNPIYPFKKERKFQDYVFIDSDESLKIYGNWKDTLERFYAIANSGAYTRILKRGTLELWKINSDRIIP